MQVDKHSLIPSRPVLSEYSDPRAFFKAMIDFRKRSERNFSVMAATKDLRKVSSALVSLILQGKRKITIDRADELSKLMGLSASEKMYFKSWLKLEENPPEQKQIIVEARHRNRKEFAVSLLNDWLNVYVKDAFRILRVQKNPQLIYQQLGAIASKNRIDKAITFLLREGYLRKTLDGRIVVETSLVTQAAPPPGTKIRAFHKAALSIAKQNIDLFTVNERFANTLVLDLTPERYQEVTLMIQEFAKELQNFAAVEDKNGEALYQILIHLTPTGGRTV